MTFIFEEVVQIEDNFASRFSSIFTSESKTDYPKIPKPIMKKYSFDKVALLGFLLLSGAEGFAQKNVTKSNDSNTPLHLIQPDYPVPYGIVKAEEVEKTLQRVHAYLEKVTPTNFINTKTNEVVSDCQKLMKIRLYKKVIFVW